MIDYKKLNKKYIPKCKRVTKIHPLGKKKFLKSHGKPSKKRNIDVFENGRDNRTENKLLEKLIFSGKDKSYKTEAGKKNKRMGDKSVDLGEKTGKIDEVRRIRIGDLVRIEYNNGDYYFGQVFRDLPHGNGSYCSR